MAVISKIYYLIVRVIFPGWLHWRN